MESACQSYCMGSAVWLRLQRVYAYLHPPLQLNSVVWHTTNHRLHAHGSTYMQVKRARAFSNFLRTISRDATHSLCLCVGM